MPLRKVPKVAVNSRNASRGLLAGVDVGGTKVAVLVVDNRFNVRARTTVPTMLDGPESTLEGIAEAIKQAVAQAGAQMSDVAAVGMGVPGRVDPEIGTVRRAVNLGWEEMPAGDMLSARLDVPCFLENDVRVASIGVQRYLGDDAPRNMAYIGIGTGIAAGLIFDGRSYRGAHGLAGEIGHMVVDPNGPQCPCGARGCLETLAAGPAIAQMGKEAARTDSHTSLRDRQPITVEAVYRAAGEGDATAQGIISRVSGYLALALQQLIMACDVECIVLGGGVSRVGDAFLQPVLAELARLREGSTLNGEMIQPDMIRLLPPDYDAGTWGAVELARRGQESGVSKET